MKRYLLICIILMVNAFSTYRAEVIFVVNSQSRTLSRIDLATDSVQNSFSILGNIPNKMLVGHDYLYVVNSGDNSIGKINKTSGVNVGNYFVELGANPWDMVRFGGHFYISGLFSSKVYKMNANSGLIEDFVMVGTAPEALAVVGNKLYVANAGNYLQNYAGSSVSVIDLSSFEVIDTIAVAANPQYLVVRDNLLHVSCTGNWAEIGGMIYIIDTIVDEVVHQIDLGGTPGNIFFDDHGSAWVADSSGEVLYKYDAQNFTLINGFNNPIMNGGSDICGNSEFMAVLVPNWGTNSQVDLYRDDFNFWKSYGVGMMPTDLKLGDSIISNEDDVSSPQVMHLFPNPAQVGEIIKVKSNIISNGMLDVYNIRGQKVFDTPIEGSEAEFSTRSLSAGVYLYRYQDKESSITGKIVLSK